MSSNGGSPTTSLRPTAAEFSPDQAFSSGYVSPPFLGGDPLEAYNPYAVPSPTAIPIPMYPDPSTSGAIVPAQVWDPTIGAFIYTYDDYTPATQLPLPLQPKNGTSTTTNNRSRARTSSSTTSNPPTSKKQSKKKQQNGTTTKEKDSIPRAQPSLISLKSTRRKALSL
ncbi:hypothetical protein BCR33DRAFT_371103 [Rhizoclosmatium globosum]|uniref:Uncharacterized protein n=1 Tax=Rhizoclosmatium globosum TaxID=329046 RepID=A0A1Y2BZF0_9FUNG|nr:hypothetical protein BCR33DRAFT_371103 [Rhizoclosmatium globosum]|eukprot:ORY40152.1 hypothetical protein BCR33DRAFT_371103 [Rhizoclosmatium globosum]